MKKLLFLLLVTFRAFVQGQNNGATIHVFQPGQQPVVTKQHMDSVRVTDKNCIKWNWSVLSRGVFLINYERYLSRSFTFELGAGVTYEDFLFTYTKSVGNSDTVQQFSTGNSYGSPGIGFCGEGGLRFYPAGYDNMEGFFIEGTVSYRKYSFPNASYTPTTSKITPGYSFLDEQLKFGWVSAPWLSDIIYEFYVGVSIRNLTANMYENLDNFNGSGNSLYTPITIKQTYPQFLLGFKIGFPF